MILGDDDDNDIFNWLLFMLSCHSSVMMIMKIEEHVQIMSEKTAIHRWTFGQQFSVKVQICGISFKASLNKSKIISVTITFINFRQPIFSV